MTYESINPYNRQFLKSYESIENRELENKLANADLSFKRWSESDLDFRLNIIEQAGKNLKNEIKYHAGIISLEMGKPMKEAITEVEKCILLCEYYCKNAGKILIQEDYSDKFHKSFVCFEPAGIVFAVMPWNFPYWQVFRFLIPNLAIGNAALLKHASNVPQCAEAMEQLLLKSGLPEFVFQNLFINYEQVEKVIKYNGVTGVTVTGSEYAGSSIAEMAGKQIKKTVLELGGSDPFIVLEDADINCAVKSGIMARMRNAGQSCIAAKRFIVHKAIYNEFVELYCRKAAELVLGDPLSEKTEMGPLSSEKLLNEVENQIKESVDKGAKILLGGKRSSVGELFFEPTVITAIKKGMSLYSQEVFGPVALVFCIENEEEAIFIANDTEFGLGASIWSGNTEKAMKMAKKINSGIVAINGIVASEPHIPFGGVKKSGYGRELAGMGLKEFANIKTINVF